MTCRFEIEFEGKDPYPRSCPECGISGACPRGYEQVKLTPEQGARLGFHYVIVDPTGHPEKDKQAKWNSLGSGIPSQVLIAIGNKRAGKEPLVPAPEGVLSVHPGEPGHETYVPRPKAHAYGPVNCNVARLRNGEARPDTCERCGYSNPQGCSWSSLAEHCLFYDHHPGFGFKLKPEYERNKPPHRGALASDPLPVPANVGIKLTRVQRAKIMDRIEQALHDAKADLNNHSVEKETEQLTKDILDILNAS
jgi:hypothetical protein